MKKYLAETIGTFFLVLTVILSVKSGAALAPIAIAVILMCMIYAGAQISGAHFNPAVTVSLIVRKSISAPEGLAYICFQVLGAVLASLCASLILGQAPDNTTAISVTSSGATPVLLSEFLFTFALAYVVLSVATTKANAGNNFYGFAISGVVLAGAISVGGISGAAFNPAVAVAATIVELISLGSLGCYIATQLVAGALAGCLVNYFSEK